MPDQGHEYNSLPDTGITIDFRMIPDSTRTSEQSNILNYRFYMGAGLLRPRTTLVQLAGDGAGGVLPLAGGGGGGPS
jgi:hypothetical protein